MLFLCGGTVAWPAAWACLAAITFVLVVYVLILVRFHPDLIDERSSPPADAKRRHKPLVAFVGVVGPAVSREPADGLRAEGRWPDCRPCTPDLS